MAKKVIKKKKKIHKGGRPRTDWKRIEPELIALIADGMSQAKACSYVGISEQTLIEYKKGNSKYSERLEKASNETTKLAHKSIKVGMLKDWKAGAWWLERTQPERFREQKQLDLTEKPTLLFKKASEEIDEEEA